MIFNGSEKSLQMVSQDFFHSQSPKHENIIEIMTMCNHVYQDYHMIIYFMTFGHHLESQLNDQQIQWKKNGDHTFSQSLGTTDSFSLNVLRIDNSHRYLNEIRVLQSARPPLLVTTSNILVLFQCCTVLSG